MKRGSSLFLKAAVILMALPVLVGFVYLIYFLSRNPINSEFALILYPIVIGILLTVPPYIFALFQGFKLLNYIDRKDAFSNLSGKVLKKIKISSFIISGIYFLILPFVYLVAKIDDASGLIIMGMVSVFAALVIAFFATILENCWMKPSTSKLKKN